MKNEPMIEMSRIEVERNFGIHECIHSKKGSPRQILVVNKRILEDFSLPSGALKENICIDNLLDLDSGDEIIINNKIRLRVTFNCEICKYIKQLEIDNINNLIGKRGYLCTVQTSGTIKVDDPVSISRKKYSVIPDKYIDRFRWIISKIPYGKVLTYSDLLILVGGSNAYLRVFPYYLKQSKDKNLPLYRIVNSKGRLLDFLDEQETKLNREGVKINNGMVDVSINKWKYENLYTV